MGKIVATIKMSDFVSKLFPDDVSIDMRMVDDNKVAEFTVRVGLGLLLDADKHDELEAKLRDFAKQFRSRQ